MLVAVQLSLLSLFYGTPSSYLWEDSCGRTHTIVQGEGGEQGDAMPRCKPIWWMEKFCPR